MKAIIVIFLISTILAPIAAEAAQDLLPPAKITMSDTDAEAALDAMAASPASIFRKYRPSVPQGMTLTSPLRVGGSEKQPVLTMALQKCMAFICDSVSMQGDITLKPVAPQGSCAKQFLMTMDLSRSETKLSDAYKALKVAICYKKGADGTGTLSFNTAAQLGPNADASSMVFKPIILDFLKRQVAPITQAVQTTLQAYQAKQPKQKQAELEQSEDSESAIPAA